MRLIPLHLPAALLLIVLAFIAPKQGYTATLDTVWFDDAVPLGAVVGGDENWSWIRKKPAPFSGTLAHQSGLVSGIHQHYFQFTENPLTTGTGETLFAYVYLDASSPPSEVMLQWYDGNWEHRAYWGANVIPWGVDATVSRRFMGPLPARGQWVRLEVPAASVGLEGRTVSGMAFTLYNGRATWDRTGKATTSASNFTVSGTVTVNGSPLAGVAFGATNGGVCTAANVSGQYNCTVPYNWTGVVTPLLAGYTFAPGSYSYSLVQANQMTQDYVASLSTVAVSGTVTVSGLPLAGVGFGASNGGACTLSDTWGQYSCTVPYNWSGTVAPLLGVYVFTPGSHSYASLTGSQTGQDFAATAVALAPPPVPASFFGMHYSSAPYQPWPSLNFSTLRTYNQWPGVSWGDIHIARGIYDWTNLDNVVNTAVAHGVDVIYTFGYAPVWASSHPTGSCDSTPAGTCYIPASIQDWRDFVTQITLRYGTKIKYWELWNEPNAGNYWKSSNADMVAMAKEAYPIIKNAGGMVLSPAPQGGNADLWMDGYFAAGGKSYLDILSFHGYLYGAPEGITVLTDKMKSVASKYNLSTLPIWDTEHSWGDPTWPFGANQDQQAAWLARYITLSFSKGIARSVWYMFDSYQGQQQWGPLFDATSKQLFKPGIAHRELYNWLINASMDPCVLIGTVYQCRVTRSGGYEGLIVWAASSDPSYTVSYTVPSQYARYKALDATTMNISSGTTLTLGMEPILLENM